jgi:protein-S-isoprenylcysteine O-methyltransferase Ste14
MHIWSLTHVQPAPLVAFIFGAFAFFLALGLKRLLQAKAESGAAAQVTSRRDRGSLAGVALQSLGIALASGPVHITAKNWSDGLMSLRMLAVSLTIAGAVGLFFWASRTMGDNWSIVARLRERHELVTTGPFALVRHPIYLGMLLFLLSLAAATAHESALPLAIPLFIIGTLVRTSREEALLRGQFGQAYDAYARRVKRFIPGLI